MSIAKIEAGMNKNSEKKEGISIGKGSSRDLKMNKHNPGTTERKISNKLALNTFGSRNSAHKGPSLVPDKIPMR